MRCNLSAMLLLGVAFLIGACGGGSGGGGGGGGQNSNATISGRVLSVSNGVAIDQATVTVGSASSKTDANGRFNMPVAPGDRIVVQIDKAGFTQSFVVASASAGKTSDVVIRLIPVAGATNIPVTTGGTAQVPNSVAQVTIPTNGLVRKSGGAAAGTVTVSVTPIDPSADGSLMPGDYTAATSGGGNVPIESFGALLVDIRDNAGERYNLAAGKTSTIRIPVGTRSLPPPATIPLFYLDENTGRWKEEGSATLSGLPPNQYYEGTVTHFSYWNADRVIDRVFVNGCVEDASGKRAPNISVVSEGVTYTGLAFATTSADGSFSVAVKKADRATVAGRGFDASSVSFSPITNVVSVGPSDVDVSLPSCLKVLPPVLRINSGSVPSGTVGKAYSASLVAENGVAPLTWSLTAGSLPPGLTLDSGTGKVTGVPTIAGTSPVKITVQDSSSTIQTASIDVSILILDNSVGSSGSLTVTNAPATVGGTFVPIPEVSAPPQVTGNDVTILFGESDLVAHTESLVARFDIASGIPATIVFGHQDLPSVPNQSWICAPPLFGDCQGASVDRATGLVTFTNVQLKELTGGTTIVLNGTLKAAPF